jgi:molybdopterin/thiamine biosynthesis adenylyltransferase
MVFTTFDNFAARYVLGLAAAHAKTPVVNGGALVLEGDVELLRANREGCIECLWEAEEGAGIAAERRLHQDGPSCSREDHEVAEIGTAIVTTNAIVGSLQALIGLAALGAPGVSPEHIDHKVQVFARDNVLARCRMQLITGQSHCSIHRRLATHEDHVERFLSYEL